MLPNKKWASDLDNHTHTTGHQKALSFAKSKGHMESICMESDGLGIPCIAIGDDLQITWMPQAFKFLYSRTELEQGYVSM